MSSKKMSCLRLFAFYILLLFAAPLSAGGCGCDLDLFGPYDTTGTFQIAPDSTFVVYEVSHYDGLFDYAGEDLIKLNLDDLSETVLFETSDSNFAITDFTVSPDGTFLIIKGDLQTPNVVQLFKLDISGGTLVLLSQNTSSDLEIEGYTISPDSSTVVYSGDAEVDGVVRLYSVPAEGGDIATLSNNTGTDISLTVGEFQITPDSSTVVYKGDTEISSVFRLYSVPINGGTVSTISGNTTSDTDLGVGNFVISDDSQYVVFGGDTEVDGVPRVHSVLLVTNTVTDLTANTNTNNGFLFQITPDSTSVVIRGVLEDDGVARLYSVPIDGSSSVTTLSNNITSDSYFVVTNFNISPDSDNIVFFGYDSAEGFKSLFSVPVDGGPVVELLEGVEEELQDIVTDDYVITQDSQTVVFIGEPEVSSVTRIYKIPVLGGTLTPILQDVEDDPARDATQFLLSDDGQCVVFYGDLSSNDNFGLYSAPIDVSSVQTLQEGFDSASSIDSMEITPDSEKLIVVETFDGIQVFDICSE